MIGNTTTIRINRTGLLHEDRVITIPRVHKNRNGKPCRWATTMIDSLVGMIESEVDYEKIHPSEFRVFA